MVVQRAAQIISYRLQGLTLCQRSRCSSLVLERALELDQAMDRR